MKVAIALVIIVAVIVAWFVLRSSAGKSPPTNVFADLRAKYFTLARNDSCPVPSSPNEPWGAMMEIGYPEAIVTTVAFTDSTASILRSSGGGFFGGGSVGAVKTAAEHFIKEAQKAQSQMTSTREFPQPSAGHTVFYLFTDNGVFTASAAESDLNGNGHQYSELYNSGLQILGEYLKLQEQQTK